jgi:tetratricopeptide (TPR) repeat protein
MQLDAETRRHPWIALDGLWLAVRSRSARDLTGALDLLHEHHCEWAWHLQCVGGSEATLHAKQSLEAWALCYQGNPGMAQLLTSQLPLLEDESSVDGVLHWSTLVSADLCGYWMQLGAHHDRYLRNEAAEEAYRKAIRVDPQRATARLQLANLLAALGKAAQASEELEEVCRLQPEWPDAHYLLGLLYESLGIMDRAEAEYRDASVCNPEYLLPEIARGRLLAAQGRLDDALGILDAVRRQGLESLDLEEALAELHNALGNEAAARAAQERAEKLTLERG